MGFLKTCAIVSTLSVLCLSVCLYTPLPEGLGQPIKIQVFLMVHSGMDLVANTMSTLGIGDYTKTLRSIFAFMASQNIKTRDETFLQITDTKFDGVPVRIYRPKAPRPASPAVVFYHGGGWTLGSADLVEKFVMKMATQARIIAVSVDYRLSPEYPFPVPFEDCLTATHHLIRHHEKYGIDPHKLAVAGDSAGGNLAAAVALKLSEDPKVPKLSLQILLYPCIQAFNFKVPSYTNPKNRALLPPYLMAWFWANYVGPTSHPDLAQAFLDNQHTSPEIKKSHYAELVNPEVALPKEYLGKVEPFDVNFGNVTLWKEIEGVILNPYFSPIMAPKLDKLPPSIVITAEHDVLRDEVLMYAQRLRQAGVKVKHREYNMLHGFAVFSDIFQVSIDSSQDICNDVKEHFQLPD